MSTERNLRLRVTLKGRPVRAYVFKKDVITVGRNPESDVFLDNPGVSRDHMRIVLTPDDVYSVEDLGSANGTFVNDCIIERRNLLNNDVIRVGKFSIWATYEEERRGEDATGKQISLNAHEGTTVLSTRELQEMIEQIREVEGKPAERTPGGVAPSAARAPALSRAAAGWLFLTALLSMVIGCVLGAGAVLLWMR